MSSHEEASPKPDGRTAAVVEHPGLASADDAAVLGMPLIEGIRKTLTDIEPKPGLATSRSCGATSL